jgi:hypothetical protein
MERMFSALTIKQILVHLWCWYFPQPPLQLILGYVSHKKLPAWAGSRCSYISRLGEPCRFLCYCLDARQTCRERRS